MRWKAKVTAEGDATRTRPVSHQFSDRHDDFPPLSFIISLLTMPLLLQENQRCWWYQGVILCARFLYLDLSSIVFTALRDLQVAR